MRVIGVLRHSMTKWFFPYMNLIVMKEGCNFYGFLMYSFGNERRRMFANITEKNVKSFVIILIPLSENRGRLKTEIGKASLHLNILSCTSPT